MINTPYRDTLVLNFLVLLLLSSSGCASVFSSGPEPVISERFRKVEADRNRPSGEYRISKGKFYRIELWRQSEDRIEVSGTKAVDCSRGPNHPEGEFCYAPFEPFTVEGEKREKLEEVISVVDYHKRRKVSFLNSFCEDRSPEDKGAFVESLQVVGWNQIVKRSRYCCSELHDRYGDRFAAAITYLDALVADRALVSLPKWLKQQPNACVVTSGKCDDCSDRQEYYGHREANDPLRKKFRQSLLEVAINNKDKKFPDRDKMSAKIRAWLKPIQPLVGESKNYCGRHGQCFHYRLSCLDSQRLLNRLENHNFTDGVEKALIKHINQRYSPRSRKELESAEPRSSSSSN